jgi:hypothetical protein
VSKEECLPHNLDQRTKWDLVLPDQQVPVILMKMRTARHMGINMEHTKLMKFTTKTINGHTPAQSWTCEFGHVNFKPVAKI